MKRRIIKATNQEYFTLTNVSSPIVDLGNKFNNQQDSEKNEEILRLMLKKQPGNSQILAGLGKFLGERAIVLLKKLSLNITLNSLIALRNMLQYG